MTSGIILSSGKGMRLGKLTEDKPKGMLTVAGKPILEYNLDILKKSGIKNIIINLYHKKDVITKYFKDGSEFGVNIIYSHEDKLYGTAGGVKRVSTFLSSTFAVIYGDNFSNCNLTEVLEYHKQKNAIATIVLFDRENNPNSGISGGCVMIDTNSKRILEFIEGKGAVTNYVNAGIYILEPEVLDYIPEDSFYDFGKDLFPFLLSKGIGIYGYLMPKYEYLFGNDTIDCYEKTMKFYKESLKGASL